MGATEWPLLALDQWRMAHHHPRTIILRIAWVALDEAPSSAIAADGDGEIKHGHIGGDRHRTEPIRADGVHRSRLDCLGDWSATAVHRFTIAVVVIEHTAGDVPVAIGYEAARHKRKFPVVVPAEVEYVVAFKTGVGYRWGDGNTDLGGGHCRILLTVCHLERWRIITGLGGGPF